MGVHFIGRALAPFIHVTEFLAPLGDLLARAWVASIFFQAGLTKLQSWTTTVQLFTYEYHVALLPPEWAAYLGTAAEIVLPILLVLGLGGRLIIFALFIYNIVAVVSYPFLLTPDGATGLASHVSWGCLLMLLMFHGSGKLSLDHWLRLRFGHHLRR